MHDTHKAAFKKIAGRDLNDTELKLFGRTFDHPIVGKFAEWVPSAWLMKMANPDVQGGGGLGNWNKDSFLPGEEQEGVENDILFANMLETGMRDPFYAGVGRVSRLVRLETGNHRIRIMLDKGILFVPAVAYVGDIEMTNIASGSTHRGIPIDLKLPEQIDIMGPYPIKEYMKLSDALVKMPI